MSFHDPGDGRSCDHCDRPGTAYEYKGERYSGLHAYHGDRICDRCLEKAHRLDAQELMDRTPITVRSHW